MTQGKKKQVNLRHDERLMLLEIVMSRREAARMRVA